LGDKVWSSAQPVPSNGYLEIEFPCVLVYTEKYDMVEIPD